MTCRIWQNNLNISKHLPDRRVTSSGSNQACGHGGSPSAEALKPAVSVFQCNTIGSDIHGHGSALILCCSRCLFPTDKYSRRSNTNRQILEVVDRVNLSLVRVILTEGAHAGAVDGS